MRKFLLIVLILCLAMRIAPVQAQAENQALSPEDSIVADLLSRMSPLEKAGQLMLVTFDGTDTDENAKITQLIRDYHIGGVVLSTAHNNFTDTEPEQSVKALIDSLQNIAFEKSQNLPDTNYPEQEKPVYIPLYAGLALNQEGDHSQKFLPGLSKLPSEMTIGATWSPELASMAGQAYGMELAKMGFNLFLGPNLDLIDTSDMSHGVYTGTNSFGSNPYWVGKIGSAFVQGLHTGSNNRVSVIATHFPGLGSADRPPNYEVSTIQRSLEQLKENELAPYLALAGSESENGSMDGLMSSHIRFQGLQGNVRNTTRPVSFDPIALQQLLEQPPLIDWRANGGIVISDSLGSPSVRNFFDPTGISFDAQGIARTAFLAGNDMLYLDNFAGSQYEDQAETIQRTITFFAQKYQEDTVFAQKVDESVSRILKNKLSLYNKFTLERVTNPPETLSETPDQNQLMLEISRAGLSLLAPKEDYLNTVFNEGPMFNDYITIFNDSRDFQTCESCARKTILGVNDFADTLLGLYGNAGTQQLADFRVNAYSFAQLSEYLENNSSHSAPYIEEHIKRARWIIFNVQNLDPNVPSSYALQKALEQNTTLLRDKMVIVFAYDAPFYLDSTEVSKLTAYYGLFTPSQASLELASRVLMQEARAVSGVPFSLPSVAYDLQFQLAPNPNQIINLALLTNREATETPQSQTPESQNTEQPDPLFRLGEAVRIQAGPILDRNGNTVPDGTKTRFTIKMAGDSLIVSMPEALTVDGFATIEYRVERDGIFAVTASSDEATTSATLILTTQGGLAEIIMPTATPLPEASPTPLPSPTPQPTPTPDPFPNGEHSNEHRRGYPSLSDWLLIIMLLIVAFSLSYTLSYYWWKGKQWAFRAGICTILGGLAAYFFLNLGIPAVNSQIQQNGTWYIVQTSIVGMVLGWIVALVWWLNDKRIKKKLNIPD